MLLQGMVSSARGRARPEPHDVGEVAGTMANDIAVHEELAVQDEMAVQEETAVQDIAVTGSAATDRPVTGVDVPGTFDVTAAPRAVLRESVRLLNIVLGEERLGSSEANARAAVRADEQRARERAEVARMIEAARRTG
jgi:hypothetical protein